LSQADLERAAERIGRIPDAYRTFSVSAERAARFYRIPGEVLDRLLELGVPHRGHHDSLAFDRNDLKSVALNLRLRSPQRAAFEAMSRGLKVMDGPVPADRVVTVQAVCPDPGHGGRCEFVLAQAVCDSPELAGVRRPGPQHFELCLGLDAGEARYLRYSTHQLQLVNEVLRLEFHPLPFQLNGDLGFLADTGLADCRLAARFLVERGRQLGVAVRGATGLLLGKPVASRHFWVEFRDKDRWLPADPFLLNALTHWRILDPASWPPDRSLLGAVWKLGLGADEPLLTDQGAPGTAGQYGLPRRIGPGYFFVR